MRSFLLLTSLLMSAVALAFALATPAQRTAFWTWLLGPPPQQVAPAPPQGIDMKRVVIDRSQPQDPVAPGPTGPGNPAGRLREEVQTGEERAGDACGGPPTLAVTEVQASKVFQFESEDGVASFSDQRPSVAPAQDVSPRYRRREQYFRVNLVLDQAPEAIRLQSNVMADTQQIFMFLARHLDVDNLRQVYLDLRLLPDRRSFNAYRRRFAPRLNTNSGFYSPSRNEAVVRLRKKDEGTLKVVRHETTHLIAAALFGNLPRWLNEGLAEYFERMDVDGLAKTITPSPYFLKLLRKHLRNGSLPRLQQHLRLSTRQWLREDDALRYGVGWSVVYYLMAEPGGRRFLATLLDAQAAHRCRRFSTADFVERHYPGGLAGLDREWRQWLGEKDPAPQYF